MPLLSQKDELGGCEDKRKGVEWNLKQTHPRSRKTIKTQETDPVEPCLILWNQNFRHCALLTAAPPPSPPTTLPPLLPILLIARPIGVAVVSIVRQLMSVAHSHIQTPSTLPYPLTDAEQQNVFLAHAQDIPRTMNSSHLTGALPGQPPMLNLYGGPPHQSQQPFHTMPHQQQPPPSQATHPALGMMSSNPTFVTSPGMQSTLQHTLQQQSHPQNPQQRMQMLQQQRPMPGGPGLMGNPNPQIQQGMFPPGMNPGMRRISAQTQPVPQGPNPMAMGPPLRPGQHNPRMLGAQPPPQSHELHLMGMGRAPPSQAPQQQLPMVNGMQPNPISRPTPGGQLNPPSHPLSHQQQTQHRPPFQTPSAMSPHHAPSPTRPPSHHGPSPESNVNPPPGPPSAVCPLCYFFQLHTPNLSSSSRTCSPCPMRRTHLNSLFSDHPAHRLPFRSPLMEIWDNQLLIIHLILPWGIVYLPRSPDSHHSNNPSTSLIHKEEAARNPLLMYCLIP